MRAAVWGGAWLRVEEGFARRVSCTATNEMYEWIDVDVSGAGIAASR